MIREAQTIKFPTDIQFLRMSRVGPAAERIIVPVIRITAVGRKLPLTRNIHNSPSNRSSLISRVNHINSNHISSSSLINRNNLPNPLNPHKNPNPPSHRNQQAVIQGEDLLRPLHQAAIRVVAAVEVEEAVTLRLPA